VIIERVCSCAFAAACVAACGNGAASASNASADPDAATGSGAGRDATFSEASTADDAALDGSRNSDAGVTRSDAGGLALVYRGPAGCTGCSEAVAALLQSSAWGFDVQYVGPNEALSIAAATLATATLYAQPGGDPSVNQAYKDLASVAPIIAQYVMSGGRYLGFCEGGYLAGRTPGFALLPGDANEYVGSPGATVTTTKDTTIQVLWRGNMRTMYFQDGPFFVLDPGASGVTTLATYTNGEIAALVARFGSGVVGVVGPHPEADSSWYQAYGLPYPGSTADLGHDLVDAVITQ
jgi:glutamine amidotransferase-like uncharacterized protein